MAYWIPGHTSKSYRFKCSACGQYVYYPQPNYKSEPAKSNWSKPQCPYQFCPYCNEAMNDEDVAIARCSESKEIAFIVRCKDCKYWWDDERHHWYCSNLSMSYARPDWFCADGER